ncbi:helix-turn-helix domain-containing protein [Alkalicoccobacillus gibsonii]|uniref:winged helix-turn-helix domain-containing protein n=1 Tax=Alkalicoccobacillus gibsonii TaxID=79881 RepID=UPI0019333E3D|nr:winged helix-turn-helix domain-containing protein [Alkalicoccobacillus gibsonii]MBM0067987.1 helix-turn-helix transcriptional regulator [Alkalicoccobacillus gibsonii]
MDNYQLIYDRIDETIATYNKYLLLMENEDHTSVSLAKTLGISQTNVAKKIKQMKKFGLIAGSGRRYWCTGKRVVDTPIGLYRRISKLIVEKPGIERKYQEQAEALGVPYKEIQSAWGYIHYYAHALRSEEVTSNK